MGEVADFRLGGRITASITEGIEGIERLAQPLGLLDVSGERADLHPGQRSGIGPRGEGGCGGRDAGMRAMGLMALVE